MHEKKKRCTYWCIALCPQMLGPVWINVISKNHLTVPDRVLLLHTTLSKHVGTVWILIPL